MILYGLLVFFVYFLFPSDAFAWGPGAHLTYALYALSKIAVYEDEAGYHHVSVWR